MRNLFLLALLFISLCAEEAIHREQEEVGLIHSKQVGRYKVLITAPENAETFDQAFDLLKPYGTLRLANITTREEALADFNVDENKTTGTAFGGIIGFDTAALYGCSLRIATYASQKVHALTSSGLSDQNSQLFDAQGNSYAYIGEAGIVYRNTRFQAMAGRILIETPYADSDDIRMSPNSFQGAWGALDISNDLQAQAYFLRGWAGVDSGDDQNVFKPLIDDGYGVAGGALIYKPDENGISLWYYNMDKVADVFYLEASGEQFVTGDFHIEWGAQGAHIRERSDSGVDGNVIGTLLILEYKSAYFGVAYNRVFTGNNTTITDGFGSGPYYTTLDKQTIGTVSALAPGKDLNAYRLNIGLDLTPFGIKGLNIELLHGHFTLEDSPVEVEESDAALSYAITDRWHLESIYSAVDLMNIDYTNPDNRAFRDFKRLVTRLDYSF
jgi:imipenem/basic amino acid-specific outer membrane pore